MGNKLSSESSGEGSSLKKLNDMALKIDLYAQRVILKEVKFNSSLSDSGKCEKLIIITSEILNRLPFRLISYMDRRHKLFSEKYEMYNAMDRALLVNTNEEILKESKLDEPNEFRKKQMCVGIARFYVQIGNLFNAVMSTMRPYNYETNRRSAPTNFYDMLTFSLFERETGKNEQKYEASNLSTFVKKHNDVQVELQRFLSMGSGDIMMTPNVCDITNNIREKKSTPLNMNSSTSPYRNKVEPSIFAALEELYFDIFHETSISNPKTPQFIEMSRQVKDKIYNRDVRDLYRIVTGKEPTDEIKTFADVGKYVADNEQIKEWCKNNKNRSFKINDTVRQDSTFVKYVNHIKTMIYNISKRRKYIVGLLDKVFIIQKKGREEMREIEERWDKSFKRVDGFDMIEPYSRDFYSLSMFHNFFINPNLTDADLQIIINDARSKIVQLYAFSYEQFYIGFQILQELSMSIQLEQATEQLTLSKEQQESLKSSSEGKNNNSLFNNADDMHNKIATKSQSSANEYKELLSKLNKRWSETRGTPKLEGEITSAIRRLIQQGERFMTNIMDTSTSEISEDTTKGEFSHELSRIDNDVFKRNNNIPNANYVPIV
jgi:hypothetical protein